MTDADCPDCESDRTQATYPMDFTNRRYPHICFNCGHQWTETRGDTSA